VRRRRRASRERHEALDPDRLGRGGKDLLLDERAPLLDRQQLAHVQILLHAGLQGAEARRVALRLVDALEPVAAGRW